LVDKKFNIQLKIYILEKFSPSRWKNNIANFKCAILIGSQLGIYLLLILRKKRELKKKRKEIFYVKASSFRNMSHNNYQKIFNSDHTGSFGTVPSPLLREYLTSNGAI